MPGGGLRDLEALTGCLLLVAIFPEVALPPFFLGIAGCRGKPAAALPHPPGMLCQGSVFLAPREELAGAFWSDDQSRS